MKQREEQRRRTPQRDSLPTNGTSTCPDAEIRTLRARIDELDTVLIGVLQHRAHLSAEVQRARLARGGPLLDLDREAGVSSRFRSGLGEPGQDMAEAVLRLCRGTTAALADPADSVTQWGKS